MNEYQWKGEKGGRREEDFESSLVHWQENTQNSLSRVF